MQYVLKLGIIPRLLYLLDASTFTIILNALWALVYLTTNNQPTQYLLLSDQRAMLCLKQLKLSSHEDIKNSVRALLNNLNNVARNLPKSNFFHTFL